MIAIVGWEQHPSRLRVNGQIDYLQELLPLQELLLPQPQPLRLSFTPALPVNRQPALSPAAGKASMGKSKLEKISHGSCSPPTAVRAVAPRQTYVVSGHEQLDVALKSDNRELTEGWLNS